MAPTAWGRRRTNVPSHIVPQCYRDPLRLGFEPESRPIRSPSTSNRCRGSSSTRTQLHSHPHSPGNRPTGTRPPCKHRPHRHRLRSGSWPARLQRKRPRPRRDKRLCLEAHRTPEWAPDSFRDPLRGSPRRKLSRHTRHWAPTCCPRRKLAFPCRGVPSKRARPAESMAVRRSQYPRRALHPYWAPQRRHPTPSRPSLRLPPLPHRYQPNQRNLQPTQLPPSSSNRPVRRACPRSSTHPIRSPLHFHWDRDSIRTRRVHQTRAGRNPTLVIRNVDAGRTYTHIAIQRKTSKGKLQDHGAPVKVEPDQLPGSRPRVPGPHHSSVSGRASVRTVARTGFS